MQAIQIETEIDENHELHLRLPATVTARRARVIVLLEERQDTTADMPASDPEEFFRQLDQLPVTERSVEEIDRFLIQERSDWYLK